MAHVPVHQDMRAKKRDGQRKDPPIKKSLRKKMIAGISTKKIPIKKVYEKKYVI